MSERESMPYDVVIVGAGPAGLVRGDPAEAARRRRGRRAFGLHARKGLGGRRAYPVGRGDRSQGARRADPRLARAGLPAGRGAGDREPPLGADAQAASVRHAALHDSRRSCTTRAPIPAASAISAAGWPGRPRRWASRSSPASRPPKSCSTTTASVKGVATGDMGVARDGSHKPDYQPGLELHAKYTFFAEGVRGHLTKELIRTVRSARRIASRRSMASASRNCGTSTPRSSARPRDPHPGLAARARRRRTAAASSIIRRTGRSRSASSPGSTTPIRYLSPFQEMQRWKTHPAIAAILEGGKRVSYGARAISDGGWQSVPKLVFPGGALIGDRAGFLNVPRIKGTHTAMKSGMMAAEAAFDAIAAGRAQRRTRPPIRQAYRRRAGSTRSCAIVRNVVPLVEKFGDTLGTVLAGRDDVAGTFRHRACPSR